ncbi:hypothetical protein PO878_10085 [Iamia majanohamensis]|uniref:Uncharacterized protein n=1 Tax=Iamia majanohamensis TaxID=467976 RepID=A0AAE9YDZ5_9ACTN|nr:hypothetical protein [Iamia majanohamensis]WCO69074.1 hypothetical protein PO878_10085 [Iamia majanohamensis]
MSHAGIDEPEQATEAQVIAWATDEGSNNTVRGRTSVALTFLGKAVAVEASDRLAPFDHGSQLVGEPPESLVRGVQLQANLEAQCSTSYLRTAPQLNADADLTPLPDGEHLGAKQRHAMAGRLEVAAMDARGVSRKGKSPDLIGELDNLPAINPGHTDAGERLRLSP